MITLRGKLKKDSDVPNSKNRDFNKRVSVRDKLLVKEVFKIMVAFHVVILYKYQFII